MACEDEAAAVSTLKASLEAAQQLAKEKLNEDPPVTSEVVAAFQAAATLATEWAAAHTLLQQCLTSNGPGGEGTG